MTVWDRQAVMLHGNSMCKLYAFQNQVMYLISYGIPGSITGSTLALEHIFGAPLLCVPPKGAHGMHIAYPASGYICF